MSVWAHVVEPARVRVAERVVVDVGVAVEGLGRGRVRHEGVGGEEPAEGGVVDTAVHVDQADAVEVLVAGEAARGLGVGGGRGAGGPVGEPALAVGVEGQALDHDAGLAGDALHRAQVVAVQVARPVGRRQVVVEDGVDGDRGAGDHVVDQFVGAADPGPALVEAADVDHVADKAVLDDALLDPCPVRAVDEAGLVAGGGLADQGRLVEGGVGEGQLGRAAGPALGQVAVGVVEIGLAAGLGHRVRAGTAVDVGPDVGLEGEVAERVVGVGRGRQGPAA